MDKKQRFDILNNIKKDVQKSCENNRKMMHILSEMETNLVGLKAAREVHNNNR